MRNSMIEKGISTLVPIRSVNRLIHNVTEIVEKIY